MATKTQTPDRLLFKETCSPGHYANIPAGAILELRPGSTWPRIIDTWIGQGRIERLAPEMAAPVGRVSIVGDDNFADWFRPAPPPPAPDPKLYVDDILGMFGWTMEEFELARGFKFPPSAGRLLVLSGNGGNDVQKVYWTSESIEKWAAQLRSLATPTMLQRV